MTGNKTHEQQRRILEDRVNTKDAGPDFDAQADLERSKRQRKVMHDNEMIREDTEPLTDPDDRQMIRGYNQESDHNKHRTDD